MIVSVGSEPLLAAPGPPSNRTMGLVKLVKKKKSEINKQNVKSNQEESLGHKKMIQMLEVHKCVYSVLRAYVRYHSGVWIFVLDATRAIC